jgi:hypothetical protein
MKLSRFHGELHGAKTAVMTSCIHTRRPVNTAITTLLHQSLARRLYRPFSWSMRQLSRGHTPVIGGFVRCLRGFRRLLWSREFFGLAPATRQVLDVARHTYSCSSVASARVYCIFKE